MKSRDWVYLSFCVVDFILQFGILLALIAIAKALT